MRQLVSDRFIDVPVPKIYKSCILIRTQYVCTSRILKPHKQSKLQYIRKTLSYLAASGLRDTSSKVRGRLMDKKIKHNMGYASISGIIEEVGSDVHGFAAGDKVAAIILNGPAYSDYYLVSASLCRKLAEETEVEDGSGLLYATIAGYIVEELKKENIEDLMITGDNLVALILEKLSTASGFQVKRYLNWDDIDSEDPGEGKKAILIGGDEDISCVHERSENYQIWAIGVESRSDRSTPNVRMIEFPDPELSNLDPYSDMPLDLPEWLSQKAIDEGIRILTSGIIEISSLIGSESQASSPIQVINSGGSEKCHTVRVDKSDRERTEDLGISFIGAGRFAREVLLPLICKQNGLYLRHVVDRNPLAARYTAERFHSVYCSTDVETAIHDEETSMVFIATYHNSHAALTTQALQAGKSVFVEKPLALDQDQLEQVVDTYNKHGGFIAVGYNRRFAPATRLALECINEEEGPTTVLCNIRSYDLVPASYYFWEKEGTRIASNACHWIDLSYLLVGRKKPISVTSVPSSKGRKDLNYSMSIDFEDGSIAVIVFSDRGENLLGGYEWTDVRRGEVSVFIDDFRRMKARKNGKTIRRWKGSRQKGHKQEINQVIDAFMGRKPLPIPFEDLVAVSSIIFCARESIFSGTRVYL
jgi:predicted dehydrogenase